jgi:biotin carboxyl carrier protein
MADIPPIPGTPMGAEPMKKSTGKVQPKKETVRINLPPKPSAAPTIKLPTLPPGGPTGASSAMPIQPPTAGAPALRSSAAPATQSRAAAPAPATQSRPAPQRAAPVAAPTVSTFDKILAIAACLAALAAVGTTVWMMMLLNTAVGTGQ